MKTLFSKFSQLIYYIFIAFFFTSCSSSEKKGCEISYPIPSENPVILTSEAQTKTVLVKHMVWLKAEKPGTDKVELNDTQSTTMNRWITVENDWIKIKYGDDLPKETIEITVKKNTSGESRSYNLATLYNQEETLITITQQ